MSPARGGAALADAPPSPGSPATPPPPRARRRPRATTVLAVAVIVLLLWLVLYPNLYVVRDSLRRFTTEGVSERGLTLASYVRFFHTPAELRALWNSLWISALSVVFSGLIGVPLAFLFHRFEFPGRRVPAALASRRENNEVNPGYSNSASCVSGVSPLS